MKIGIITLWGSNNNYGQVLQAYALQKFLRNYGFDVKHINYTLKHRTLLLDEIMTLIKSPKWFVKKYILKLFVYLPEKLKGERFEKIKDRNFDGFRKKYLIQFDNNYSTIEELQEDVFDVDALITGSDQVWGLNIDKNSSAYYLNFGGNNIKKISYAASFGNKYKSSMYIRMARDYIKDFDLVTVREKSGIEICKKMGYMEAKLVLDPTLLLSASDYYDLFRSNKLDSWNDKKKLFCYFLNFSKKKDIAWDAIQFYMKKESYSERIVISSGGLKPAFDRLGYNHYYFPDPINWMYSISSCDKVITNSFHGLVFSVIFHKTFLYIPLQGQGEDLNERIYSFLDIIGLKDRIFNRDLPISDQMNKEIQWTSVDSFLDKKRQDSMNILFKYLH